MYHHHYFRSLIQEKDNLTADPILINYFQNIGNALSVACDNPQNGMNDKYNLALLYSTSVHILHVQHYNTHTIL